MPFVGVRTWEPMPQTKETPMLSKTRNKLGIVLFPEFETPDVFGPVQMWGRLPDYEVVMMSERGGLVASSQGVETSAPFSFADAPQLEILMVPGGAGTRHEVENSAMMDFVYRQNRATRYTTSVCTGAALLARAGLIRGRNATTNKKAWTWATSQGPDVIWQPRARWVVDGKYVTSSGVAAGTDMALGLVELIYDRGYAASIAQEAEYIWNASPDDDLFSVDDHGPMLPRSSSSAAIEPAATTPSTSLA